MKSTNVDRLEKEIMDLLAESMAVRDQISALENQDAKLSNLILQKRRQLAVIRVNIDFKENI